MGIVYTETIAVVGLSLSEVGALKKHHQVMRDRLEDTWKAGCLQVVKPWNAWNPRKV